jgi:cytosine/adenosine deaminase-related metal-dependent hydrolase
MRTILADFIFDGKSLHRQAYLTISSLGEIISLSKTAPAQTEVEYIKGILLPGMINAHCHLELSHLKGIIPKQTGLVDFILNINSKRNQFDANTIQQQIEQAELEMIQHGIVAVGDICNTTDTFNIKKQNNLLYHNFIETFGLLDYNASQRFEEKVNILQQFQTIQNSSIVAHAPYSVSDKLFQLIDEFDPHQLSTIHNQECEAENELSLYGKGDFIRLFQIILQSESINYSPTGKSSLQTFLPKFKHLQHLICVHNTHTSKADIDFANSTNKNIFWCLCPNANLYIENNLPDVEMLYLSNSKIVIGTDSLASNEVLNIWHELYTLHSHFPLIPIEDKLSWATYNGALALRMEKHLGQFKYGMTPGIIHIEQFSLENPFDANATINVLAKASVCE